MCFIIFKPGNEYQFQGPFKSEQEAANYAFGYYAEWELGEIECFANVEPEKIQNFLEWNITE